MDNFDFIKSFKQWQLLGFAGLVCVAACIGMQGFGITFDRSDSASAFAAILAIVLFTLSYFSYQKAEDRRLERDRLAAEIIKDRHGVKMGDATQLAVKNLMEDD